MADAAVCPTMLKIAFLIRSFNYGGAERQLIALARGLSAEHHRVSVLYFYAGGALEEELKNSGVEMICLHKRGRWDVVGFLLRLVKSVRRLRPEVLHGYLDIPNLLVLFLKIFCSPVKVVWGVRASSLKLSPHDRLTYLSFQLERRLSRFVDLIIVNSQAGYSTHLAEAFAPDKMVVIPNGIDVERFKPDMDARAKVRAEWGIPEGAKLIGMVGRIDPVKDHPVFLKAAALLSRERGEVRFACVGGGDELYKAEMCRLAVELGIAGKVVWAEQRADMAAIYNAFDLATLTSLAEGFPNVVGEAMACGVPCVVTDVGDSSFIVGETGLTVPPHRPDALAAAWGRWLDADNPAAGQEARARIVEKFGVRQLIQRTTRAILGEQTGPQN